MALIGSAFAAPAFAQSSVTLYGIVDGGLVYNSNKAGHSLYGFQSGAAYGDRWGLKGSEDLGSGTTAFFDLQNGFNIGTGAFGASNTEFNRQAYVGIGNTQYGSLSFGRQYEAITDLLESYSPDFSGGGGVYAGDLSNYDNSIRINNSIKYKTIMWNGFTAEGVYGFGNTAGSVNAGQSYSLGLNYVAGPLAVGAAYLHMNNQYYATRAAAVAGGWSGSATDNTQNAVLTGFTTAKSYATANAVAAYTFNNLTVGLNYAHTTFKPSAVSVVQQEMNFNSGGIGAHYVLSPAISVNANASWTAGSVPTGTATERPQYGTVAASAFYNLSKRTAFYVYGGYIHAKGDTYNSTGQIVGATANLGDAGNGAASNGRNQTIVRIGMYNKF
jgi:predicted porin